MMHAHPGAPSLQPKVTTGDPMRTGDRSPPERRGWASAAVPPVCSTTARRTCAAAQVQTEDAARVLRHLDLVQRRLPARDARRVRGPDHPCVVREQRI